MGRFSAGTSLFVDILHAEKLLGGLGNQRELRRRDGLSIEFGVLPPAIRIRFATAA
jgi:hypothetical protein